MRKPPPQNWFIKRRGLGLTIFGNGIVANTKTIPHHHGRNIMKYFRDFTGNNFITENGGIGWRRNP